MIGINDRQCKVLLTKVQFTEIWKMFNYLQQ